MEPGPEPGRLLRRGEGSRRFRYFAQAFESLSKGGSIKSIGLESMDCCFDHLDSLLQLKSVTVVIERCDAVIVRYGKFENAAVAKLPIAVEPR